MLSSITSGLIVHDVCNEILKKLNERQWDIPGIRVGRETIGSSTRPPSAYGEEFSLEFGVWRRELFPVRIVTPRTEINIWPSEGSRSLTVNRYADTDWERHKRWFIDEAHKYHGRKHGLPRYLPYQSKCDCGDPRGAIFEGIAAPIAFMRGEGELPPRNVLHEHRNDWRCPLLVFSDHYGSEYEPAGEEPAVLRTDQVLTEARVWLEVYLLPSL